MMKSTNSAYSRLRPHPREEQQVGQLLCRLIVDAIEVMVPV
jgi:hypothetical protein